ncbi:MAG TPA: dTDP-4-dehydrorhamnose reductase [Candidatus Sulfotelmatobacter sp.]
MRILIFGASGLLGKALQREWDKDELILPTSGDADIRDEAQVISVAERSKPDWVVLSAAYTDVDGCESNQQQAFSVNRHGAVNVARAALQQGSRLLFLSSDYVFDGSKASPYETDDPRCPRSVYGRSKAEAETSLLEILPQCCIVRTSWLFGMGGKCFPDTILKLAVTRNALDVVNDQRASPTYTVDLARALMQLCRKNASGIVHVTNRGDCTWFDFAQFILKESGLPTEVRPVSSDQMARPAPRPAYSVLSPRSLEQFQISMPAWKDAAMRYLKERAASA